MSAHELPFNVDAEQAVLGGLMLAPSALAKISDWLDEQAFFRRDDQLIYRAVCALSAKGDPVDAVTLADWFDDNDLGDLIGGPAYLIELANMTPSAANIVAYAEIVAEKAKLRSAVTAGESLVQAALAPGAEAGLVLAQAAHELAQLQASEQRGGLEPVRPIMKQWFHSLKERYEGGGKASGLPTPWHDLNKVIRGLQEGELTILAGRPNMGKSVLGLQIAIFCALRGIRTALFSLEMTHQQVMDRAVACVGGVDFEWLKSPDSASEEQWPRVTNAMTQIYEAPLLIDETPGLSAAQLEARVRRAHLQAPLGLIVIDHIHEMQIEGENENLEHARNARAIKRIAKSVGCASLALAQLNRKVEDRQDKRPRMSDLRGSGGLEEVADLILFAHREDYYDPGTHLKGLLEVMVAKGRDVKTGSSVHLLNRFDQMRAEDYDGFLPEPPEPVTKKSGWGRKARNDD